MADPQRLNKLRQQRDIIAAHLKWLDEQISEEAGQASSWRADSTPTPTFSAPITPQATTRLAGDLSLAAADPDALLEELVEEDETAGFQVSKTGCWIIFSAIMLIVGGAGVWAIYHFWG